MWNVTVNNFLFVGGRICIDTVAVLGAPVWAVKEVVTFAPGRGIRLRLSVLIKIHAAAVRTTVEHERAIRAFVHCGSMFYVPFGFVAPFRKDETP